MREFSDGQNGLVDGLSKDRADYQVKTLKSLYRVDDLIEAPTLAAETALACALPPARVKIPSISISPSPLVTAEEIIV